LPKVLKIHEHKYLKRDSPREWIVEAIFTLLVMAVTRDQHFTLALVASRTASELIRSEQYWIGTHQR